MFFRVVFPLYSGAFFPAIFRACPFSFLYISPWWWSCFLPCFFWWFLGAFSVLFSVLFFVFFVLCFFCAFYRAFFHAFFRSFSCFFSCFFFRALGGTQDKQPQYFAFWPVRFLVLFLVVTTSEDRIYTTYDLCFTNLADILVLTSMASLVLAIYIRVLGRFLEG